MNAERTYTIAQASSHTGLSGDTIRYYERIQLLPPPVRKENGHRRYTDDDIATMKLLLCLKKTGLSLEEMKPFLGISLDGDLTEHQDLIDMMESHREKVRAQMEELAKVVAFIDEKLGNRSLGNPGCEGN